jgi:integrase
MIQLQLATGMRPGEVIRMRGCDLNMAGKVWEYTPETHKTQHHGKRRVIYIGPRGQQIIREFLKADLSAYLFSPADARTEFDATRTASRKTPITPSQASRTKLPNPRKKPGERYTVCSYGQAVRKACELAFGMPTELRKLPPGLSDEEKTERRRRASEWRKVHAWHPHQLRHSAATLLRREFGIEASRVVLGHASAAVTEVYAEMDHNKAREVMAKIG